MDDSRVPIRLAKDATHDISHGKKMVNYVFEDEEEEVKIFSCRLLILINLFSFLRCFLVITSGISPQMKRYVIKLSDLDSDTTKLMGLFLRWKLIWCMNPALILYPANSL